MSSSAWADYLDARLRLVHQWAAAGLGVEEMARRLTPAPEQLERAALSPIEPPLPGSSRWQVAEWRSRTVLLEDQVHALETPLLDPSRRETEVLRASHVRALMSHPDPTACGCQYWADAPALGQHHCNCAYAEDPW